MLKNTYIHRPINKEICPEMHAIAKLTNVPKHLLSIKENNKYSKNNNMMKQATAARITILQGRKRKGPHKYNENNENNKYSENIQSSKR